MSARKRQQNWQTPWRHETTATRPSEIDADSIENIYTNPLLTVEALFKDVSYFREKNAKKSANKIDEQGETDRVVSGSIPAVDAVQMQLLDAESCWPRPDSNPERAA